MIDGLDTELYTQFKLEQYENWLIAFDQIIQDRLNHCAEEHVAGHLYQQIKVKNELDNVRGLY